MQQGARIYCREPCYATESHDMQQGAMICCRELRELQGARRGSGSHDVLQGRHDVLKEALKCCNEP